MWFIIALIVGVLVGALVLWVRSRNIRVSWYEWFIGVIGLFLLLFTIQNYFSAQEEFEFAAGNMFLLVIGLPGLILLAIAWSLAWRRNRSAA